MQGVGWVHQQTFVDTTSKVAFASVSDRKTPITAADLLNDRVVPFFDAQEVTLCRVLTGRGTEYCGSPRAPAGSPRPAPHRASPPPAPACGAGRPARPSGGRGRGSAATRPTSGRSGRRRSGGAWRSG
jgi:hypothetical protein